MSITALRRADADDTSLLRRARRGDRRAHRLYSRRHAERALALVELLIADSADSAIVASRVLAATVAEGVAGDDALVRCAVRLTAPLTTDDGLARLVVALTDGDGRTEDEVAGLIDRPVVDVAALRARAYAEVGGAPVTGRECRGWPLVARKDRLTTAEREAAEGHLALCRQCRVRLDEQRHSRDKIWAGGGAVSGILVADVISLSLPAGGALAGSGLASVVLGKAGVAIVGATALTVAATSAGVAMARHTPSQQQRTPVPAVAPGHPGGTASSNPQPAQRGATTTGSKSDGAATQGKPPDKTQSVGGAPLPAVTPTAVPPLPLPLPVPLPTKLAPLPSGLPLPTPSISVSLPPLPLPSLPTLPLLPTSGPLLGH